MMQQFAKHCFAISVCLVVLITAVSPADATRRRKVLILHSYHQGLQWTDAISKGIQEAFQPHVKQFELYYDYLDTKRNAGDDYLLNLYRLQKAKLSNVDFSVIIAADNNALAFVVEHGEALYGNVPVVFCGINNFNPKMLAEHTNITGIAENTDFKGTLSLIRKLNPERRHITVIVDRTVTGEAIRKNLEPELLNFPDMEFVFFQDFLLTEAHSRIGRLGPRDAIYLLAFNRDRDNNFISYTEGIEMIRNASSVPIYGSWDFYLDKGIVGGIITRGIDQGRAAGKMALAILEGQAPSSIPIDYNGATIPMFDYRELERFGISHEGLPSNSIVINPPPTLMDRYAHQIFVLLGVLTCLSAAMGIRLFIIRRRNKRLLEMTKILDAKVEQRTQQLEIEKAKLEDTLGQVKTLQGLLPICSACKKIRDDQGYWNQIEEYISYHTEAAFTHGICPDCARRLYPDLYKPE